jgi:putative endonuclease
MDLNGVYDAYPKHALGKFGEMVAENLMINKGYQIVAKNWKNGHLEIDIIAKNKKEIVFVEVKTRSSIICGLPVEQVRDDQKKNLIASANTYIKKNNIQLIPRFDIVGIAVNPNNMQILDITHIENAFFYINENRYIHS